MPFRATTFTPVDPFSGAPTGAPRTVLRRAAAKVAPPAPPPPPASPMDAEPVPDGDVERVLSWVGHDVDRAMAALVAEQSRGQSERRDALIDQLQGRITG